MVKVDEYARIRRAHYVDGLSIKALARQCSGPQKLDSRISENFGDGN